MTGRLAGRVALVTGAGRNIGRAIALEFAREGADVVINVKANRSEAETVAEEARAFGVHALVVTGDVADKAQVDALAAQTLSAFGQVDFWSAMQPSAPKRRSPRSAWKSGVRRSV